MPTRILCAILLGLMCLTVSAGDYTQGALRILSPWARATPPGAPVAGGFLTLTNTGAADRLLDARATISESVELHTMMMDGDVMRMQRLEHGIEVPAHATVELRPGGLHVMFVGLKAPLKAGTSFPLTLHFEHAGSVQVRMEVQDMGAMGYGH